MITVTDKAKERINELIKENKMDDSYYLRVGVKGGGCSGLSYVLEFDDKDTKDDEVFENNDVKVVCDKKSVLYLFGTELHYSGGLNGKGFEFINPNAARVCGCGSSFSV
jgi:iron-sulfur cluster assembly protein